MSKKNPYTLMYEGKKSRTVQHAFGDDLMNLLDRPLEEKIDRDKCLWLMDQGAVLDVADEEGLTPLHFAARRNESELVLAMIKAGAKTEARDDDGNTALHWACGWAAEKSVYILVNAGADMLAKNNQERDPYEDAVNAGHEKITFFILKKTTDILRAHEKFRLELPEEPVPIYIGRGLGRQLVDGMLEENGNYRYRRHTDFLMDVPGISLEERNFKNETPLIAAINAEDEKTVLRLIKRGANVDAAGKDSDTPLMLAAKRGLPAVASILIKAGAKISVTNDDDKTALDIAHAEGHAKIIDLIEKVISFRNDFSRAAQEKTETPVIPAIKKTSFADALKKATTPPPPAKHQIHGPKKYRRKIRPDNEGPKI